MDVRRRDVVGAAVAAMVPLPAAVAADDRALTVMSFNVRYAADTPPHAWAERRAAAAAAIARAGADLVGTQELLRRQGDDLVAALPGYRWLGRDRRGGHDDEHMGILYRPDRLRLIDQGDFWLSDTPDVPGSAAWGADLPRMANWGVFETKGRTPRRLLFLDTHLAHRAQDADARVRSADAIVARLPALSGNLPVVVAGDFNATPDSAAVATMSRVLTDAWTAAARRRGPEGTFHDFTGRADRRIDYLFVRGFRVEEAEVDDRAGAGGYPSDHFPLVARLRFGA